MNSRVQLEGVAATNAVRQCELAELLVSLDGTANSVRVVARGPAADNLSTFRKGHPIRIDGQLAFDAKGLFVIALTVSAGRR